jgi:two-component system cell cycle sensor histidine kinase/response regulator CckA
MTTTQQPPPEVVSASDRFIGSVVIVYVASIFVSRVFFLREGWSLAMVWPAAGISVFGLLRVRGRRLPVLVGALVLSNFVATIATGLSLIPSLGYAMANGVESYFAAEMLFRLRRARAQLSGPVDLLYIVLASCTAAMAGGCIGALLSSSSTSYVDFWWYWSRNHFLGILVVIVALLPWTGSRSGGRQQRKCHAAECVGFVIVLGVVLCLLLGQPRLHTHVVPFFVLPVLIWSACRMPLCFTTVGGLLVAVATTLGTRAGNGLFASLPYPPHTRMAASELFSAVTLISSTLVALVLQERERAQQQARASEEEYRDLIDTAEEGVWIIGADTRTSFVNAKMAEMLGYRAEEMLGRPAQEFTDEPSAAAASAILASRRSDAKRDRMECKYRRKDGTSVWVWQSISPRLSEQGSWIGDVAMMSDITERKRADKEREVTIEFLHLVNQVSGTRELIGAATLFFQQQSGCEAVGIRLREGEDYPYFEERGFSREFTEAGSRLCVCNAVGEVAGDKSGKPLLQCVCGAVIRGEVDASKSFFTAGGSFFTNNSGCLVAQVPELRERARGRCIGENHESVALIPLASGAERFGLLQLSDHRAGMFSPQGISLWERLAGQLSVALAKCRAEDALKQSEEKNRNLLEQASDAIFTTDFHGNLLTANSRTCEMLGYALDEVLDLNMNDIVSRRELNSSPLRFDDVAEGRTVLLERNYCRKDGTLVPVESSAKRTSDNIIQIIARDITERKRNEAALRQSESRFRSLVQNAPYGICRSHMDGQFMAVNPRFLEMLGCDSARELPVAGIAGLCSDPARGIDLIRSIGREGKIRGAQVSWKRKDGQEITVRLSALFVPGEAHFEVFTEDISENVELEAQLRQAQKLEALGALAGGIAHDFNNVLMIIDTFAAMLMEQSVAEDPKRAQLNKILHAARRGANLTRQLLAFSRKQVLNTSVLDLDAVIADLLGMLSPLIGEDIRLDVRANSELWPVRGDRGQIEQVIINLAVNARDAMAKGGILTLGARNVHLDTAYVQKNKDARTGDFVELFVADTGCGMSPEIASRIFDPFFTTKELGRGTGLGLSTAYGIVKQSDGWIDLETQEGEGTTFHVYLPRTMEDETQPAGDHQSSLPSLHGARVLVVEDEDATREALCAYLEQKGFGVVAAANAVQALAACSDIDSMPDVILTDVVLPDLSGADFVELVRRDHPGIKAILMSGYTDDRVSAHILTNPGLVFLQKPFALQQLLGNLQALLD